MIGPVVLEKRETGSNSGHLAGPLTLPFAWARLYANGGVAASEIAAAIEVRVLPLVLPGEAMALPHVRPALAAGVLQRAALEAVVVPLGVRLRRGRLAEQAAQVDEVLLRRGALLQFRGMPLRYELAGDHVGGVSLLGGFLAVTPSTSPVRDGHVQFPSTRKATRFIRLGWCGTLSADPRAGSGLRVHVHGLCLAEGHRTGSTGLWPPFRCALAAGSPIPLRVLGRCWEGPPLPYRGCGIGDERHHQFVVVERDQGFCAGPRLLVIASKRWRSFLFRATVFSYSGQLRWATSKCNSVPALR